MKTAAVCISLDNSKTIRVLYGEINCTQLIKKTDKDHKYCLIKLVRYYFRDYMMLNQGAVSDLLITFLV